MSHSESSQVSSAYRRDDKVLPDAPLAETASANQEANVAAGAELGDLFDDDDDDDEYQASSAPETKDGASSAPE